MELTGRVAVVTGASSGIGEATLRALAGAGMHVVGVARREDRLTALAATSPRVHAVRTDVTVPEDVAALARYVSDEFGVCHALVNNAGMPGGRRFRGPADIAELEQIMDVNFYGTVRCTAAFAELLFASAPAHVVNVASVAGKIGLGPPAYHASKFAVVGFTEALAVDWGRRGVAVTQLNPGFIRTEGFPQERLMGTAARWLVPGPEIVAEAIVDVLRRPRFERTVPRWYRPLVTLRHVAGPLFWAGARRAGGGRRFSGDRARR